MHISCSVISDCLGPHGACQVPLSMRFSRKEYWSGLPFPSPGNLLNLRIEIGSPALQVDSLPSEPSGKPMGGLISSSGSKNNNNNNNKVY